MGYMQIISNSIHKFGLGHTMIIGKSVGLTDYLLVGIACFDHTLRHVTYIDGWYNIVAGTDDKILARLHAADKTTETGVITRTIDPTWTYDNNGSASIFYQVSNQFLACYLSATIGIIFRVIGMIFSYNTLEMVTIDRDRTGVNDTLHASVHCCMHQIRQPLYIDRAIHILRPPGSCFSGDIIDALHTLHSTFQ